MKEVTRIRIAKISYDIDLTAKKKLETYLTALSEYAEDDNVLEDIEIRMTELFEKRGVKSGDVIDADDVDSIRETLGEPREFSGDGDIAVGPDEASDGVVKRKLYRDIDGAVLGGVFSGMASFFKVNALWLRLAFIVLLFISFGLAAFVYAVLWIVIPAAKTVTEKLQMRGEAASLVNIRKYNESQEGLVSTKEKIESRRRGFGIFVGILGVLGALGAAVATAGGGIAWATASSSTNFNDYAWIAFGLMIASGVLLTLLSILISYSGFVAKVTARSVVAGVVIIIAGILTFAGGAGIVAYGAWQKNDEIQQSIKERSITLPTNFSEVKKLTISANNANIDYRVSGDTRATISSVPGMNAIVTQDGIQATLKVELARDANTSFSYPATIIVYGPQLDEIDATGESSIQYSSKTQQLALTVQNGANIALTGNYTLLSASIKQLSSLSADNASVKSVEIAMENNSSAHLGNIETMKVQQPSACPNNSKAQLWIESIAASTYNYNGTEIVKTSQNIACGLVQIGGQEDLYPVY